MSSRWLSNSHARTRALTALAAVLAGALAPRVYAQVRIGVIDVRRAVAETGEGRAAFDALKQRYDVRQAELDRRTKAIETLKRRIEHPTAPIPQARLEKMAQSYQQQVGELQQLGQQYTSELQAVEGQLTQGILAKLQPIVREVGQSDNSQLIVEQQVVLFAPTNLNITDRVIQMYNQRYPQHGPVVLPDAGVATVAPTPPMGAADASTALAPPELGTAPPETSADAGGHALPTVFFRRDAGH